MKRNKFLVCLIILSIISACLFFVSCTPTLPTDPENSDLAKITLSKTTLTLEKLEDFTLTADLEDVSEQITWSSSNEEVASVNNGKVVALSKGVAVIKAKTEKAEGKCQVWVTDNNLTLNIKTNLGDNGLNLIAGDEFDVSYSVTYNNKAVDSTNSVSVKGGDNSIITFNDGKITAVANGSAQIIFTASWSGLTVQKVVDVNVVSNLTAKLLDSTEVTLYNDVKGGDTSVKFNAEVFENDVKLNDEDFEIISCAYDESIISFDDKTLTISAIKKGATDFIATIKSKSSNNIVSTKIHFTVELFDDDKTDLITIPDAYLSDGTYEILLNEVYADLSTNELLGLAIESVEDVTNGTPVALNYESGVIDMSDFEDNAISGARKWRVRCGKYSYIVKIKVGELNYAKTIVGKYNSNEFNYPIELKIENRVRKFVVYNSSKVEVYSGTFDMIAWNNTSGSITLKSTTVWAGQKDISGAYWFSNGSIFMDLNIWAAGKRVEYCIDDGAPYERVAGTYSSQSWLVDFALNADKTCTFDLNNELSLKENGTYVLKATSIDSGKIIMQFANGLEGQTIFEGTYKLVNGVYNFTIKMNYNNRELTYTQNDKAFVPYSNFAGIYSAKPSWLQFKLYADGSLILDIAGWGGTGKGAPNCAGVYELNVIDATSGTITIKLNKPYVNNAEFTGSYSLVDGVYKFAFAVPGSGIEGNITFTQLK